LRLSCSQSGVSGLRKETIGFAYSVASKGCDLCKSSFARSQLVSEPAEFLTFPYKIVIYRTEEIRERILQCLRKEVVTRAVEQLLAADDLVLRLETKCKCMSHIRRERGARLSGQWFVNVVVDPAPASEERDETFRVGCLSQTVGLGYLNDLADFDEALLARSATRSGTSPRDECLAGGEL
jgi:hypothetical protein